LGELGNRVTKSILVGTDARSGVPRSSRDDRKRASLAQVNDETSNRPLK